MKSKNILINATLATVAILGLGLTASVASAQTKVNPVRWGPKGTAYVLRGPNGAAHLVNQKPHTSSLRGDPGFPKLKTRGPNGAAHIIERDAVGEPSSTNPENRFPKLETRGPNGAAYIVD